MRTCSTYDKTSPMSLLDVALHRIVPVGRAEAWAPLRQDIAAKLRGYVRH
jgi:hypothetical protein